MYKDLKLFENRIKIYFWINTFKYKGGIGFHFDIFPALKIGNNEDYFVISLSWLIFEIQIGYDKDNY